MRFDPLSLFANRATRAWKMATALGLAVEFGSESLWASPCVVVAFALDQMVGGILLMLVLVQLLVVLYEPCARANAVDRGDVMTAMMLGFFDGSFTVEEEGTIMLQEIAGLFSTKCFFVIMAFVLAFDGGFIIVIVVIIVVVVFVRFVVLILRFVVIIVVVVRFVVVLILMFVVVLVRFVVVLIFRFVVMMLLGRFVVVIVGIMVIFTVLMFVGMLVAMFAVLMFVAMLAVLTFVVMFSHVGGGISLFVLLVGIRLYRILLFSRILVGLIFMPFVMTFRWMVLMLIVAVMTVLSRLVFRWLRRVRGLGG